MTRGRRALVLRVETERAALRMKHRSLKKRGCFREKNKGCVLRKK